MLISIALFFFLYLFNLLVNKKLIVNYLVSTILSIIITYLIYLISNDCFSVISFLLILLLTLIICFMFAFLIKQFSFHLISKLDISSPLLISSLLILYISNITNLSSLSIISNLTLFLMLFVILFYASKNKVTYVLSLNALIILLSIIFNIVLVLDNLLLFLLVSVALSLNKSKIKILNTVLTFACLLICLIINNNSNPLTYFIFSIIISLLQLFININEETYEDKTYYKQYINNKKEIIYQLDNFRNMFSSLSNNFYNARLSKILNYLKEDVFDRESAVELLIDFLLRKYPTDLQTKYAVSLEAEDDVNSVMTKIATSRGCLKAGGLLDLDKVDQLVLRDFRTGRLGRFTVDEP